MAKMREMFKKDRKSFLLFLVLLSVLSTSQAFAGIGIYVGGMSGTVDSYDQSFKFKNDPANYRDSRLVRDESNQSSLLGLNYTFGVYKKIDASVGFEMAGLVYKARYTPSPDSRQHGTTIKEDLAVARVSLEATALYHLKTYKVKSFDVSFHAGGGLSMASFLLPATSEYLKEKVSSADKKVDLAEHAVDTKGIVGAHLMAAMKIKPDYSKVGFQVFAKYNYFPDISDDVSSSTVSLGLGVFWKK